MEVFRVFKNENVFITENFSVALSRLEKAVEAYDKDQWASLDYSSFALSEILALDNKKELPLLIEALCNLNPNLLEPKYYFVENGEFEEISEFEVFEAAKHQFIINPFTGLEDFNFRPKIIRRFALSKGVLESD